MNKTVVVTMIVVNGILFTLSSCNTLWLQAGQSIVISGDTYNVVSVVPNDNFIITHPTAVPNVSAFDLTLPHYFYGAFRKTAEELVNIPDATNKLPFIYLHEVTQENFYGSSENNVERESDCDLFFLAPNKDTWSLNYQYEDLAIDPMRNMADSFLTACQQHPSTIMFEDIQDQFQGYNRVKWGNEDQFGYNKRIFAEDVSGYQLKIKISFVKNCAC